jgi:hypothetical protein
MPCSAHARPHIRSAPSLYPYLEYHPHPFRTDTLQAGSQWTFLAHQGRLLFRNSPIATWKSPFNHTNAFEYQKSESRCNEACRLPTRRAGISRSRRTFLPRTRIHLPSTSSTIILPTIISILTAQPRKDYRRAALHRQRCNLFSFLHLEQGSWADLCRHCANATRSPLQGVRGQKYRHNTLFKMHAHPPPRQILASSQTWASTLCLRFHGNGPNGLSPFQRQGCSYRSDKHYSRT